MLETLKSILFDREPGEGYFGGAEGAIRFVLLAAIVGIATVVYYIG